ncbi:MAG TPA: hypothetical protein VK530_04505, partial [Candidatus Acidoferrum sp.]|nr:hypothetical protein [Candidatus Acidoferrum sp.]
MLNVLVGLGIGVALGVIIGWLLAARRSSSTVAGTPGANSFQPLLDELRQQLSAREAVLAQVQSDLATTKSILAAA